MSNMRLRELSKLKPGAKFIFISGDGLTKTKVGDVLSLDGTYISTVYTNKRPDATTVHLSIHSYEVIWFKGE